MPASRDWTADKFFDAATQELTYDVNDPLFVQRYDLVNHAVEKVYEVLYPIIGNFFRKRIPYTVALPGRYLTVAGGGTFTAATKTITSANMNIVFNASDVERLCIFRYNATSYATYVDSFVSSTQITVRGNSLPSSDIAALDAIEIPTTTPVDTSLMLAQLRIDRSGEQVKFSLESSVTDFVDSLSLEEYKTWRDTAVNNQKRIVYCLQGDELLVKSGSGLSTLGTLNLYYPSIPTRIVTGVDKVELPDGACMQVAIMALKMTIAKRQGKDFAVYRDEMSSWISLMYKAAGVAQQYEIIAERIKNLI
jgi:hypothetical protein